MNDMVQSPAHYQGENGLQAWQVIEDWGLDYHLGNAVKYILRHHRKGAPRQDLDKAMVYLIRRREISYHIPIKWLNPRPSSIPETQVVVAFDIPGGQGGPLARALSEIKLSASAIIPIDARTHLVRAEAHLGSALEG